MAKHIVKANNVPPAIIMSSLPQAPAPSAPQEAQEVTPQVEATLVADTQELTPSAPQEVTPQVEATPVAETQAPAPSAPQEAQEPAPSAPLDPAALMMQAAKAAGMTLPELLKGMLSAIAPASVPTPQTVKYEKSPNAYRHAKLNLASRLVFVAPNPKRPGSAAHARYAKYPIADGTWTLEKILVELPFGPTTADFLYDIRAGFVKVEV